MVKEEVGYMCNVIMHLLYLIIFLLISYFPVIELFFIQVKLDTNFVTISLAANERFAPWQSRQFHFRSSSDTPSLLRNSPTRVTPLMI